jgi:drug/metabolite transporter (DMT)-like permease
LNIPFNKNIKLLVAGILFALLWPSASVTTKIGLHYAQPFVMAVIRFFFAGIIMLVSAHIVLQKKLPQRQQWKQLAIYGFLNISTYLGLYVLAMQNVAAGLGSLSIATNPVLISLISTIWFKQQLKPVVIISLLLCFTGVTIAAYPLLVHSYATPTGLALLMGSMLCYSVGAIYFSRCNWGQLHVLTINGWQTILGGLFLLPLAIYFYDGSKNNYTGSLIFCIAWLAIPVSIVAVQLWLYLLKDNPVKASFWLFLCPVFGFVLASLVMKEPLSWFTLAGVIFVVGGLYLVQKQKRAAGN